MGGGLIEPKCFEVITHNIKESPDKNPLVLCMYRIVMVSHALVLEKQSSDFFRPNQ